MQVDRDSQVIILPRSSTVESSREYKIINLPVTLSSAASTPTKSYLIQDSEIYELNVIKGDNSNSKLKLGDAVKSFIFEPIPESIETNEESSTDGAPQGAVLQSCHTIVTSPYNFTYLLATIFEKHGDKFSRFHTLDDIRDTLSSLELGHDWVYDIPRAVFMKSLANICESIAEGGSEEKDLKEGNEDIGDRFYKYSPDKSIAWVNSKVLALKQWILHSDDNRKTTNSIVSKIKKELHDPTGTDDPSNVQNETQHELTNQMALLYAIDYICDSYVPIIKPKLISHFDYNFTQVDDYLTNLEQKQKNLEVVEANMNEVITTTANTTKASVAAKKNGKKKPVKKVAVGKGALDGFFKKA
ncbi:hypothetical protein CORT_0C04630 [Candida orthopsilosis Co 90-125]|uniref:Ribonuclease H2 subunit B n=1 Tax=Candida orthopsilosis (strain 90-125) TaxID=1136231 RepID=H8X2X7_CANO9|nr:hypothetical protein CORT_0C04630 [Candida orthopsilosis Co 90-125]CCG25837.1 hypothetical protein CORT_0C04630 [Candida orthopsilosis Co 90-125]